jgi:hypothetical protein
MNRLPAVTGRLLMTDSAPITSAVCSAKWRVAQTRPPELAPGARVQAGGRAFRAARRIEVALQLLLPAQAPSGARPQVARPMRWNETRS